MNTLLNFGKRFPANYLSIGMLVLFVFATAPADGTASGGGRAQTEEQMLLASDGEEAARFGSAVCLSDDTAICGTPYTSGYINSTGFAYVYRYDPGTQTWGEEQKIFASDGEINDYFGVSVAIFGDTAVVGADGENMAGSWSGSAYVFEYDAGAGTWSEKQKLIGSDTAGNDRFGGECNIEGDVMLISGPRNDDLGSDSGSAYVFRYDPGSDLWVEEQKLLASDGEADAKFGWGISISGDLALVGAHNHNQSGAAYVFRYDPGSGTWSEEQKLLPADNAYLDYFGYSVDITDDIALVGCQNDDDAGGDSGSVYVYRYSPGVAKWVLEEKLIGSNNPASAQMATCLSVDESSLGVKVLAGAPKEDTTAADAGAAYLFDVSGGGDPVIDIKINGEDDPGQVWHKDTVTMTLSLYPFSQTGVAQDWWVIGWLNSANLYFWIWPAGWGASPGRAHAGPLFELDEFVFTQAQLPMGSWEFVFAVDALNYAWEGTYMDLVEIYSY